MKRLKNNWRRFADFLLNLEEIFLDSNKSWYVGPKRYREDSPRKPARNENGGDLSGVRGDAFGVSGDVNGIYGDLKNK